MRVIDLSDITLISSSVSETEYALYDSATTYDIGDRVIVAYESDGVTDRTPHEIYESLTTSNLGNYPPDNASDWSLISATNRWAMFDQYSNTQTTDTVAIEVVVDASNTNCVGFTKLVGTSVTLSLVYDGDTIKTETIDLDTTPTVDYWEYFFAPYEYKESFIWEYPIYVGSELHVTIEPVDGEATCGMLGIGFTYELGITEYAPKVGIDDYSTKDTDDFGRTYLLQRDYAKINAYTFWLDNPKVDSILRLLSRWRSTPCFFDGNNPAVDYESLVIYGYYKTFTIDVPGPMKSRCSIEIEELI